MFSNTLLYDMVLYSMVLDFTGVFDSKNPLRSLYEFFKICLYITQNWARPPKIMQQRDSYIIEPGHEKMCLMLYVNNKGADQPAHSRSLISAFVVRCLDSVISLDPIAEIPRL